MSRAQGVGDRHRRDTNRGTVRGRKGTGHRRETNPETIENANAKPDVADDVYVALKNPEKGDYNCAAGNTSKAFFG